MGVDKLKSVPMCFTGLWEKGPLEPYISGKPMRVLFIVPKNLAEKARLFAKELKTLYHACRLGTIEVVRHLYCWYLTNWYS